MAKGALDDLKAMREAQGVPLVWKGVSSRTDAISVAPKPDKARITDIREKLAPVSSDLAQVSSGGVAALIATFREGIAAGESDAELYDRYRNHMASRGGLASAAKLSKDEKVERARKAGKAPKTRRPRE